MMTTESLIFYVGNSMILNNKYLLMSISCYLKPYFFIFIIKVRSLKIILFIEFR